MSLWHRNGYCLLNRPLWGRHPFGWAHGAKPRAMPGDALLYTITFNAVAQNEIHASQGAEFRLKYLNFRGTGEGIRHHEIYIIHFRDDSRKL